MFGTTSTSICMLRHQSCTLTAFRPWQTRTNCCDWNTLLLLMFLGLRKLGNIYCGHKMFLNKVRNIFCVPDTKFVSAKFRAGNICVGNNVSSFARALTSAEAGNLS